MRRDRGTGRFRGCRALALAAALALALWGCGKRGDLEPPPDPSVAAEPASDTGMAIPRRHKPAPIARPAGAFILDPLL